MTDLVVTDTSCLIALDRIGHLYVLPTLFVVYAPGAVADEFGSAPPWLQVERVEESEDLRMLLQTLHRGEAEAIVLAQGFPGARLLVDEARGRAVARRRGLLVTGTAGVLLAAKTAGVIPSLQPLLDALIHKHSFRLSRALYDHLLDAADES